MSATDVDLRKLRYFVAVAEHLNFGGAATALLVAQPALSRQIRALEDELQVRLFERDKRRTELTRAGEQLLADAPALLANAEAVRRRVGIASRGTDTFTVAFMPGIVVTSATRAFEALAPDVMVEVFRTGWHNQVEVLRDGRADVSYVRLPVERSGLRLRSVTTEPRVAVFAADHRLAGKATVSIVDLAGEHLIQNPDAVQRADLASAVVTDIGPSQVALAWETGRHITLLQAFLSVAEAIDLPAPTSSRD
ncbi:MAG: hypothetical protein QOK11_1722 [Pseudonocardiales bacterium]|nr:hypothetical protein [Pseudonocardiales bacterium]